VWCEGSGVLNRVGSRETRRGFKRGRRRVTKTTRQFYYAFRRIKNFACVEIHPQTKKLLVYLSSIQRCITLEPGFTRDVTKIGHFGTGNLEVAIGSPHDFERAQALIQASDQAS
jgi:predicted transport protein